MTTPNHFVVDISHQEDICKICLESDETESRLFAPCRCSGSICKIHEHCLQEWISKTTNQTEKTKCTLCDTEYRFTSAKKHALTHVCIAFNYNFFTVSIYNYCVAGIMGFLVNLLFSPIPKNQLFDVLKIVYISCAFFYFIVLLEFMHVWYVSYFYQLRKYIVFRSCYLPAINSLFMGSLVLTSTLGLNIWRDELNFVLMALSSIMLNQTVTILYKNLANVLSKRKILPYTTPLLLPPNIDEKIYEYEHELDSDRGTVIEINMHK
jgi:hypothetical protein